MQSNIAVMILICYLLCLSFNYTLPLRRGEMKRSLIGTYYGNYSNFCPKTVHPGKNLNRSKKTATNIENFVKRIKDSTKEIGKRYEHLNTGKRFDDKHRLNEEDLRQYEQLVIMKKYPYLDLKELELKYSPSADKNIRQSVYCASDSIVAEDPSLSESLDEGPYVEINNRGLSGFAIPVTLSKIGNTAAQHVSEVNGKDPRVNEFKNVEKLSKNFRVLPDRIP